MSGNPGTDYLLTVWIMKQSEKFPSTLSTLESYSGVNWCPSSQTSDDPVWKCKTKSKSGGGSQSVFQGTLGGVWSLRAFQMVCKVKTIFVIIVTKRQGTICLFHSVTWVTISGNEGRTTQLNAIQVAESGAYKMIIVLSQWVLGTLFCSHG